MADPAAGEAGSLWRRVLDNPVVRNEWDQLSVHLSFIAFGVWSLIDTASRNAARASDLWWFGVVFAGLVLSVGALSIWAQFFGGYNKRIWSNWVFAVALGMLAILLVLVTRNPFSILAAGFALQGVNAARTLHRQKRLADIVLGTDGEGDEGEGDDGDEDRSVSRD